MAAQSAGQQHEALNAQKVSDDGVDSVRLTSDKVAVGRRDGSLRVYADGTQVVSYNNCGSRIIQIDWDASSNISGAPRRRRSCGGSTSAKGRR